MTAWCFRLLVLACVVVPAAGCGGTGDDGPTSDPFAYDRGASLDVRELGSWQRDGATVHDVSYASARGGRVPAFVVVPDGDGPFAGLIVQHGMPSSRRDMLSIALEFARLGAIAVAIDAPFARRSGAPVRFDERDRAEQIQLIVDLRRALDLLRARGDVDEARIAYLGISYGAALPGRGAATEAGRVVRLWTSVAPAGRL